MKKEAEAHFEKANSLLEENNEDEAAEAFNQAIEKAQKAEQFELLIDIIFSYKEIASEEKKKEILNLSLQPLDELISKAKSKEDYQELSHLLEKKALCLKSLNKDFESTQLEAGKIYQKL
ncbi:MAG: hypothetical protein GF308_11990, partial [Candidatus Heimdallarchaeota archaeon]|nr:hypothetical protein [Candidatus Heimdallarchaeota archaeon]